MKKMRCKNCGTIIKETDFSCPICHMKPERTEEEVKKVEEKIIGGNEQKKLILKMVILFLFLAGIVLTFLGFIHLKDVTYCTDGKCSSNNLFILALGASLTLSSLITLIRFRNK